MKRNRGWGIGIVSCFSFFLVCGLVSAKEEVRGYVGFVFNQKKEPVYRASLNVELRNQKHKLFKTFHVFTDAQGKWWIPIKEKRNRFLHGKISAFGYLPKPFYIEVKPQLLIFKKAKLFKYKAKPKKNRAILEKDFTFLEYGTRDWLLMGLGGKELQTIDQFLKNGDLREVREIYNNFKWHQRPAVNACIGFHLIDRKLYDEARPYFVLIGEKHWQQAMGKVFRQKNELKKAASFYNQGYPSLERARFYEALALHLKSTDNTAAAAYFHRAAMDYEELLKSFSYTWSGQYVSKRSQCVFMRDKISGKSGPYARTKELKKLLQKTGRYCQRLKKAAVHFFCREKKVETLNYSKDMKLDDQTGFFRARSGDKKGFNEYTYDYQLIKEGKRVEETRRELYHFVRIGGIVDTYAISKPLYGPYGLLGFEWQRYFDYKIIGREAMGKDNFVIVEAIPAGDNRENRLFGRAWINEWNGSVRKIEWNLRNTNIKEDKIKQNIWLLRAAPEITCVSEYNLLKNGLCFPSVNTLEEAYRDGRGSKHVRVLVKTRFYKYKFFYVGTRVAQEKVGREK